jgi:hypothetical protein
MVGYGSQSMEFGPGEITVKKCFLLAAAILMSAGISFAENVVDDWANSSAEMFFKVQLPCTSNIPPLSAKGGGVSWRVSVQQCGGAAAIVTTGSFSGYFSWVARNGVGADRIPYQNCEVNKCSVAKVQKTYNGILNGQKVKVWCLGTSGKSVLGKTFRRITGKRPAVTRDPRTDIVRYCINPEVNKN